MWWFRDSQRHQALVQAVRGGRIYGVVEAGAWPAAIIDSHGMLGIAPGDRITFREVGIGPGGLVLGDRAELIKRR